jgi:hypothetical protein
MSKFNNVPAEQDTKILFSQEAILGEYDVLYQKWYWDGVTAESIIFLAEDIFGLNDDEIKKEVQDSPLVNGGSSITLKRSDSGYVFVNFNFIAE